MHLLGGDAGDANDPAAHHRRFDQPRVGRVHIQKGLEVGLLSASDIKEIEIRRSGRAGLQLHAQIDVDQRQRDDDREAEAKRQHHRRRRRARAMQIGQRQPPFDRPARGAARAPAPSRPRRRRAARPAPAPSPRRRLPRRCAAGWRRSPPAPAPRAAATAPNSVARAAFSARRRRRGRETARSPEIVRAPERRDREGERGQQAVERAERQFARVEVAARADRAAPRRRAPRRDRGSPRRATSPMATPSAGDGEKLDQAPARRPRRRSRRAPSGSPASARLRFEKPARRIGDADAADHQRNQPDQREELAEPIDVAGKIGRSTLARVRTSQPASGKPALAVARSAPARRRRWRRRPRGFISNARRPADQRARLDEAARRERRVRDQHARAEADRRCRAGPAR